MAGNVEHPAGKDLTDERVDKDILLDISTSLLVPGIVDADVGNGFHVDVIVVGVGPVDGLVEAVSFFILRALAF